MLISYTMNQTENINAPKVNTFIPYGMTDKLFTGGALYFNSMKRTKFPNASGIYRIQSKVNNKIYIGSSINFKSRKYSHFKSLKNKKHTNKHLQNHVNKYGIDDFQFSILEYCPKDKLIEREQYYIDTLNPEFNICKIAKSCLGVIRSEETKRKIKENHADISGKNNPFYGKHQFGKDNPFYGKQHTEETIKKHSEFVKAWYKTEEGEKCRQNQSKIKKGKPTWNKGKIGIYTEEVRKKMGKSKIGKPPWNKGLTKETDQRIKKYSDANKGEKNSMFGKPAWNKGLTKETDQRVEKYATSNIGRESWNKRLTKETDQRVKKIVIL